MGTRRDFPPAQQQSKPVPTDPYTNKKNGVSGRPYNYHTQGMAPSPGKSFLDAVTGQEVFGASIEGENPQITAPLTNTETVAPHPAMISPHPNTISPHTAKISPQPAKPQPNTQPRR